MNTHTYIIPNLAVVTVRSDVVELVQSAVEFQLGYFAATAGAPVPDLPRIAVAPYAEFKATAGGGAIFHQQRAEFGHLLDAPGERHATKRTADGFEVFTDSPIILVILLLQVVALRQGRSFLHAAGWCDQSGAVTLLPGPGGVGKTALLSAAVQRHGARLLGDDLVLVGKSGASAFPRAFVLKDYHRGLFPEFFAEAQAMQQGRDRWRPLVRFLRENVPFHGLTKAVFRRFGRLESASAWLQVHSARSEYLTVPVDRLFGGQRIAVGGPVRRVIYVERHEQPDFQVSSLDREIAVQRSVAVLHHEWSDFLRWFSALGAVGIVDYGAQMRGTESAFRDAFAGAELTLLQVPKLATPAALEEAFAKLVGFATKES